MKGLQLVVYWALVLVGMGLGANGDAYNLIFAICAFACLVLLSGYFVFRPAGKVLALSIPSIHALKVEEADVVRQAFGFLGKSLPLGDTRTIYLRVARRNVGTIWCLIPVGLLLAVWNHGSSNPGHDVGGVFGAELAVVFCVGAIVGSALRFFFECYLLNDSRAVFTRDYVPGGGFYSGLQFSFLDEAGNYRGGEDRLVASQWQQGELALVFYDRKNPDRNRANFGLRYHEVQWATVAEVAAAARVRK